MMKRRTTWITFLLLWIGATAPALALEAHFDVEPGTRVAVNQEVFFNAMSSTHDGDHDVLATGRYEWDFGDGYTLKFHTGGTGGGDPRYYIKDSGVGATHFFMRPGTFTVTLTVTLFASYQGEAVPVGDPIATDTYTRQITVTGEAPMDGFEVWHAPFHGRIGQYCYAQIPSAHRNNATRMRVDLTNGNGYSATLFDRDRLAAEEKFLLDHRPLPRGDYVMTTGLYNGSQRLTVWVERFTKAYDGLPKIGIDENNNLCRNGEPFFLITDFHTGAGSSASIRQWADQVNVFYADGFGPLPIDTWKQTLDRIHSEGQVIAGPGHYHHGVYGGARVNNGTPEHFRNYFSRNFSINAIEDYVNAVKDHPANFGYVWYDEPDLGSYNTETPPAILGAWAWQCHVNDPHHPMISLKTASGYRPYDRRENSNKWGTRFDFLYSRYQFGKLYNPVDVIGFDFYPLSWRHGTAVARYPDRGVMDQYCEIIESAVKSNHNMYPMFSCVEVTQISTDNNQDPGPTSEQVIMEAWMNVVHGMKGVLWFPYFDAAGRRHDAMEAFTKQVADLGPALLGPEIDRQVSDNSNARDNRVDFMVREHNNTLYIFAVRVTEVDSRVYNANEPATISTTFTIDGLSSGQVRVFDENRTLSLQNGRFTDTFPECGVHIYTIALDDDRPATPGSSRILDLK